MTAQQMNATALHDLAGAVKDIAHRRAGVMSAYEVANLELAHEQLNWAAKRVSPQPPTREQIAESDIAAVEEMGGCVLPTEIGMRAAFEWLARQEGVRPDWYAEEVPAILAGIDAARRLLALLNGADRG